MLHTPRHLHKRFAYSSTAGTKDALKLFHLASQRIPAYKDFLQKNNIKPSAIRTYADFQQVPYTDKKNYISQYKLAELCWGGDLSGLNYIVSSSGTSGEPFFWPRGSRQDLVSAQVYADVFNALFDLDDQPSLIINSYGQGSWIAGTELYNTVRLLGQKQRNMTVINPGIEIELAVMQIQALAALYAKVVICGYPPFIRDLIDSGAHQGIDWSQLDLYILTAGEAISPAWREYMLKQIGRTNQSARIANVLGLADAGVIAAESKNSHWIEHTLLARESSLPDSLGGERTISLHQFRPDLRFIESDSDHQLILTTHSGLPLVRYNTQDHGLVLPAKSMAESIGRHHKGAMPQPTDTRPYLCLFGREDYSISFYAVNIYPENIRMTLDAIAQKLGLTSRFVMYITHQKDLNQVFHIDLEAQQHSDKKPSTTELATSIVKDLKQHNSEYNELHTKLGQRAVPKISIKPFGAIGYIAGKKHRWAKKD